MLRSFGQPLRNIVQQDPTMLHEMLHPFEQSFRAKKDIVEQHYHFALNAVKLG